MTFGWSAGLIGAIRATALQPGLPGATKRVPIDADLAHALAKACSRAPEPRISTFVLCSRIHFPVLDALPRPRLFGVITCGNWLLALDVEASDGNRRRGTACTHGLCRGQAGSAPHCNIENRPRYG